MVASSTVFSAIIGVAFAVPAAAQYQGTINVDEACRSQIGSNYYAVTVGDGCNDWKCSFNGRQFYGINLDAACAAQYNNGFVYASCSGGVNDWACYIWFLSSITKRKSSRSIAYIYVVKSLPYQEFTSRRRGIVKGFISNGSSIPSSHINTDYIIPLKDSRIVFSTND